LAAQKEGEAFAMKRGSDWSPIYMLIVVVIAAILIITLIKPIFQQSAVTASQNIGQANQVARSAVLLLPWVLRRR